MLNEMDAKNIPLRGSQGTKYEDVFQFSHFKCFKAKELFNLGNQEFK